MKIVWFLLFFFISPCVCAQHVVESIHFGENFNKPIHISVHVESKQVLSNSLVVAFWRDFIYETALEDSILTVRLDNQNNFCFQLPAIKRIGRVVAYNSELGLLFDHEIVAPGDSIQLLVKLRGRDDFDVIFSGRGSEKYSFAKKAGLNNTSSGKELNNEENPYQMLRITELELENKLQLLDQYPNIDRQTRSVLKFDVIGSMLKKLLLLLRYKYREAEGSTKLEFEKVLNGLVDYNLIDAEAIVLSKHYIEYLYEKNKLELIYLYGDNGISNGKSFTFKNLYDKLKNSYAGVVREKLLTFCIINVWDLKIFFKGVDADEFTLSMRDASELIQTDYLKQVVSKELSTTGKGAKAFNFSLPDSTGQIVNLQDFLGKVVLVDIWEFPCGGCVQFKEDFERIVLPKIKDNPNVVVISLNLNAERSKWLSSLKRYSNARFVNLHTGGLGWNHPIAKHYNIIGIPYLLLVDREGNIFSTTIPFLDRGEDLLTLIQEAMNQ